MSMECHLGSPDIQICPCGAVPCLNPTKVAILLKNSRESCHPARELRIYTRLIRKDPESLNKPLIFDGQQLLHRIKCRRRISACFICVNFEIVDDPTRL